MSLVLITGATGLVGSYLAKELLRKGEQVRAIRRSTSSMKLLGDAAEKIEWVEGDVLDVTSLQEAMQGVKCVYHSAAVISYEAKKVPHMMKVNIQGTANVVNAALEAGVEKLLHVSSIAAFGISKENKVIDEKYVDSEISKCFNYYISKHYGEREVWRGEAEGLKVVIVCPSTILGVGDFNTVPCSIFRDIQKGFPFYSNSTNAFVDVRDVVDCMVQLMDSNISGEKFIVSAENLSLRELMWMIADEFGAKRPAIATNKWLNEIAWRMIALRSLFNNQTPVITKESAAVALVNFHYSNEKVKAALCIRFRPMRETVRDVCASYLQMLKQ